MLNIFLKLYHHGTIHLQQLRLLPKNSWQKSWRSRVFYDVTGTFYLFWDVSGSSMCCCLRVFIMCCIPRDYGCKSGVSKRNINANTIMTMAPTPSMMHKTVVLLYPKCSMSSGLLKRVFSIRIEIIQVKS